jgi:hypothetical protein
MITRGSWASVPIATVRERDLRKKFFLKWTEIDHLDLPSNRTYHRPNYRESFLGLWGFHIPAKAIDGHPTKGESGLIDVLGEDEEGCTFVVLGVTLDRDKVPLKRSIVVVKDYFLSELFNWDSYNQLLGK